MKRRPNFTFHLGAEDTDITEYIEGRAKAMFSENGVRVSLGSVVKGIIRKEMQASKCVSTQVTTAD